jgi:hypothetical protein
VAARSDLQRRWRPLEAILAKIYSKWLQQRWVKKTLRVLASIYKSKRPSNGQMDKSTLG